MAKTRYFLATLAALFASATAWSFDTDDLSNPAILEAFVDGVVKPHMAESHSPSGVFALMKDGELVLAKGYGWQNIAERIPVDPYKTLFRPGSISKLFTFIAAMQLAEQGKLDIDADVNTYLKNFQLEDTYPGQPVTIRHCMTHTPGFEEAVLGFFVIDETAKPMTLAEAVKAYEPKRVNPPGTTGAYSNYCVALTGVVVSNISGMEFNDYVKAHIFDVLGMHDSTFQGPLPTEMEKHLAVGYGYANGKYSELPFELIRLAPAGNMSTTAMDMLKFGTALLNGGEYQGGRILQTKTLEEMEKIQFTYDERINGIGLGFFHYWFTAPDTMGHDGGTSIFNSHFTVTPSANMVIFSSFSGPGGAATGSALEHTIYPEFFPIPRYHDTPPADFASRAAQFAGSYALIRHAYSTFEKLSALVSQQVQVSPTEEGELLIGPQRYVEIGDRLFRGVADGRRIVFQKNDRGEITGYVQDGEPYHAMYKIPSYAKLNLNIALVGLSLLVFLFVVLRRLYQHERVRTLPAADKKAIRAAWLTAALHWWAVIFGAVTLISVGNQILMRIPGMFKFWLIFPIIAALASLYLLYQTAVVWKNGLLRGVFERLRYTMVCLCGVLLSWFYYYWNILGFQYL